MTSLNTEQLFRELDTIKEMLTQVIATQTATNGRLRKAEKQVAILWALLALIGTGIIGIGVPVALALSGH